ncbi:MAG: hypothetical protein CM1200mP2_58240 [Planctomycetaceae bacterium]|nr:MAG: hypothetical protein CM1200mP2_58240 [Planctomycetaceae bacterium]
MASQSETPKGPATAAQIEFLIEEELPSASDSDKRLWAEELEGLSLQSAREILQLKQSLNSLERPAEPSETNRSHEGDRTVEIDRFPRQDT